MGFIQWPHESLVFDVCPLGVLLSGPVRGGEGLRVPSSSTGTVTSKHERNNGSLSFRQGGNSQGIGLERENRGHSLGKLHAKTQGSFRVSYSWRREGRLIVARRCVFGSKIKKNIFRPPRQSSGNTKPCIAASTKRKLYGFNESWNFSNGRTPPGQSGRTVSKAEFRKQIASVKKLHAQWDENHVFIQTEKEAFGNPLVLNTPKNESLSLPFPREKQREGRSP
jgi:hypothetical protein